jgi:hypothetical protein
MRVIFLDFDGVLNTNASVGMAVPSEGQIGDELWTAAWLDRTLVARLAGLVAQTAAVLVISSSWRLRRSREELATMLAERGGAIDVVDVTPRLPRPPEGERLVRASEIAAWLDRHPEVSTFVILDDHADFGLLAGRHVHVDPAVGLTDEDVQRAIEVLAEPWRRCAGDSLQDVDE